MAPVYAAAGVTADQVRVWRVEDAQRVKEWETAREQSADAYADQVAEVANNPRLDSGHARVRIDALKWLAARRNPKTYGDKAQLDVNVRTIDLTRIIDAANARLEQARAGRVIEHEPAPAAALADLL